MSSDSPEHPLPSPTAVYVIGRALLRPYLKLRYRPIVSGLSHVPRQGSVLFVSNHLSTLDVVLIPTFSPRQVQFLAKSQAFRTRFSNWFMRSIGAIPVDRTDSGAAATALDLGKQVLDRGGVFGIFPEGSRSTTGLLNRGRGGAAWLALESGATIVPVGIIGTDRRRDHVGAMPRVELRFGAPLDLSHLADLAPGRARREATEQLMHAIQRLSGQKQSGEYAPGSGG